MAASAVMAGKQPAKKNKNPHRHVPKTAAQETEMNEPPQPESSREDQTSATISKSPTRGEMARGSTDTHPGDDEQDTTTDVFDEALPILPKGIVENTAEIYAEVASYDVVPPERLKEYWRVYTITHRKLFDPTAHRLEAFWWHVWGSNRRRLSGKTLAKLYENISTGPTFVPLRGPANRYEGPSIPLILRQLMAQEAALDAAERAPKPSRSIPGSASIAAQHVLVRSGDSDQPSSGENHKNDNSDDDDGEQMGSESLAAEDRQALEAAQLKILSSSSSRPPPSQSILKKPRPSFSGPRPTPRFALPSADQSEDDEGQQTSASASDNTAASSTASGSGSSSGKQSGKRRTSTSSGTGDRAKATKHDPKAPRSPKTKHAKKKFVASSSASKRKSHLPKHSGPTGGEAAAAREVISLMASRQTEQHTLIEEDDDEDNTQRVGPRHSTHKPPRSPVEATPARPEVTQQTHKQQPPHPQKPSMSAKAAGKQPVRSGSSSSQQQQRQLEEEPQPQRDPSPASTTSTTSVSHPTVPISASMGRSLGQRPTLVRQDSGPSMSPSSVASSTGSGILEMPMVSRNRAAPNRPGGLRRHYALPSGMEVSSGLDIGRGTTTTAPITFGRSPVTTSQLSQTQGTGTVAGGSPSSLASVAPRLFRSFSQESYGQQQQPGAESRSTPVPSVMSSASIAAPSTVPVRAVFSEVEGQDTLDFYRSTTGLDDDSPTQRRAPDNPVYNEHNPNHRQVFMPTRPTPTPRIPFARTRSQLNIILDRDRERSTQSAFAAWRESRESRDHGSSRDGQGSSS